MINRRELVGSAALGALGGASLVLPASAQQNYPSRPIRVLIGFPGGSGADILGRFFTAKLAEKSGQPVLVENKPGANSNLAVSLVANAKPDGYTLLFVANSNMAGSRFLFKGLSFDTVKDFTPAASFAQIAFVMLVAANSPIQNVQQLVEHLKKTPKAVHGVTNQMAILSTAYFHQKTGTKSTEVAYRTAPEALPDVVNGTLDYMIMDGTFAAGAIRQGRVRPLAVTTAKRIPTLPDTPTMMEAGVPDFDFSPWWGVYAPAGTPDPIVKQIGQWMNEISTSPEAAKFLETVASLPLSDDGPGTAARLQKDIETWAPIVKAAGIQPQEIK
ncbi:MAG TPA: tripartite tricarboxylate transporter substrate binding protein [Xanthobacteraceae bacterium]|nr:tripartite tricarboxylate transporter substrate binding protein [Xanthobacteraceae bacterium]